MARKKDEGIQQEETKKKVTKKTEPKKAGARKAASKKVEAQEAGADKEIVKKEVLADSKMDTPEKMIARFKNYYPDKDALKIDIIKRAWADPKFRKMLIEDPKKVLEKEYKIIMPKDIEVKVLDETPKTYYLVIPVEPDKNVIKMDDDNKSLLINKIALCW